MTVSVVLEVQPQNAGTVLPEQYAWYSDVVFICEELVVCFVAFTEKATNKSVFKMFRTTS